MDYEKFIIKASLYLSRKIGRNFLGLHQSDDTHVIITSWTYGDEKTVIRYEYYIDKSLSYVKMFNEFANWVSLSYSKLIKEEMKEAVADDREPCEVENGLTEMESLRNEREVMKNKLSESERTVEGLVKQIESLNDELDVLKEALDTYSEKDEKIEDLINLCDSKDEEIKRLTLISDESLKDKIHAERAGRQLDVFRVKVECAAEILNNLI